MHMLWRREWDLLELGSIQVHFACADRCFHVFKWAHDCKSAAQSRSVLGCAYLADVGGGGPVRGHIIAREYTKVLIVMEVKAHSDCVLWCAVAATLDCS